MLPVNRRLKKASFEKIMKEGTFWHADNFYLRLFDRKDGLPSLFAFVVPIKVKKTSVGRHLIKRKMTAVVERISADVKPGFSVILFVKKVPSSPIYKNLEEEILSLLFKTKILNQGAI